jgi:hypothetical protein
MSGSGCTTPCWSVWPERLFDCADLHLYAIIATLDKPLGPMVHKIWQTFCPHHLICAYPDLWLGRSTGGQPQENLKALFEEGLDPRGAASLRRWSSSDPHALRDTAAKMYQPF